MKISDQQTDGNFRKSQEESNVKKMSESSVSSIMELESLRGSVTTIMGSNTPIHINNNNNNSNTNSRLLDNSSHSNQSLIGERGIILGLLRRILKRDSVSITNEDPTLKVIYLGNVVTSWAKAEGCLERPASALWRNHSSGRGSIKMTVSVTQTGLKAQTAEHGLTEYWANRLTWTGVPIDYPKLFCWIYRHEGRKLKQELRCHAVLCPDHQKAVCLATSLRNRLAEALFDFRREKILRQNARLSIVQSLYPNNYCSHVHLQNNYKQPLDKQRSAPKLTSIEELLEDFDCPNKMMESSINEEIPEQVQHNHHHQQQQQQQKAEEKEEEEEEEGQGEGEEPKVSTLNLPNLNSYSKVMLHLLEYDDQVSSNSDPLDPVNCDSDSQHEEHEELNEEEMNDDNISDESGYTEESIQNNNNNNNNSNNNNTNHNNINKTKPSSLVLFDNLSFQI